MPELDELIAQVKRLSSDLDKRVGEHTLIEPYLVGDAPFPPAITAARLTEVYRYLMPVSEAPWGSLVVDSKLDRLEVAGFRDINNPDGAKKVWADGWQGNHMDSESKLAHAASLLDGRCYATVWADKHGNPDVALDDITQMIVEFEEGSRHKRAAALRRWQEGRTTYARLFRPEGIYKFKGPDGSSGQTVDSWTLLPDEFLENPFGLVNVVEVAINRRLKPGRLPYARGEFAHCTGLIDRINLLTFLGLVIAFWMGFPLRGVIGDKIRREVLKDDDGNPIVDEDTGKDKTKVIPPFDLHPDSIFQLENPAAKLAEFQAADRRNLSVFEELDHLAVITKTPRHYFPMPGGMANLSAEAITASEGAMHAAVTGHKSTLGEGWEEVMRLCGTVLSTDISPQAEMMWLDQESRSLAERADAASKLKDVLPPAAIAELALNVTQDQMDRWTAQSATNPLLALMAAAGSTQTRAVPSANGAG